MQMDAVANYTLEIRDDLVGTAINTTLQEFNEIRVRTYKCLITKKITVSHVNLPRTPWWLI